MDRQRCRMPRTAAYRPSEVPTASGFEPETGSRAAPGKRSGSSSGPYEEVRSATFPVVLRYDMSGPPPRGRAWRVFESINTR